MPAKNISEIKSAEKVRVLFKYCLNLFIHLVNTILSPAVAKR